MIIKTIREQKEKIQTYVKIQQKESERVNFKNELEMRKTFETEKKEMEAKFRSEKKDYEAKFESEKKSMEAEMESMKARFESFRNNFESNSKKPEESYFESENNNCKDSMEENSKMQLHEDLYLSSSEDEVNIDSSNDITHNEMAGMIKNKSLEVEVHQLTLQVNCYKSMVKKLRDQAQVLYKENSDQKRYIMNMEAKSREETLLAPRK